MYIYIVDRRRLGMLSGISIRSMYSTLLYLLYCTCTRCAGGGGGGGGDKRACVWGGGGPQDRQTDRQMGTDHIRGPQGGGLYLPYRVYTYSTYSTVRVSTLPGTILVPRARTQPEVEATVPNRVYIRCKLIAISTLDT